MEQYINQLIEDIQNAQRPESEHVEEEKEFDIEAHFAEVDRFVSGEGEEPLGEILGFEEIQFPPIEKLNDNQMQRISEAFVECLFSWNITAEIPEEAPISLRYSLLVSTLKKQVYIQNSGFIHLEFCQYDVETCPFGNEFCQCKDFDIDFDDMDSFEYKDGELPF
jgi:hypothetical protein